MAVAFDAKATADTTGTGTSPQTISNMTVGASATLLIASFCAANTTAPGIPSAMTWNGVAMTLIGNKTQSDGLANTYVYGLVNPATGNHSLVVTYTNGTGGNIGIYIDAWSFSGTDTSSLANAVPAANVLTDASTPTGTAYPTTAFSVTTVSGDAACAVMECDAVQFSTTTGTLIRTDGATNGNYTSAFRLAVGASTSLQFTGGASGSPACAVAFRIQQPQAAANPFLPVDFQMPHRVQASAIDKSVSLNPNLFNNPLPFNQYDWAKPVRTPQAPIDLSLRTNLELFKNPIPIFNQFEPAKPFRLPLALPIPPDPLNINLFTNPYPFNQFDWSKPVTSRRASVTLPDPLNINLFTNPFPFNQTDWSKPFRVPRSPYSPTDPLNINLFTNPFPIFNIDYAKPLLARSVPLVDAAYSQPLYQVTVVVQAFIPVDFTVSRKLPSAPFSEAPFNPNLFTNPIPVLNLFTPPRAQPPSSPLDAGYNQNLYVVTVVALPFAQMDTFRPFFPRPSPPLTEALNPNVFTNPIPILNISYPPAQALRGSAPYDAAYNQSLYSVTVTISPFITVDLPRPFFPRSAPALAESLNPNLFTNPFPFNQFDYPQARRTSQAPFDLSVTLNLNIFTNPIPFAQYDWPQVRRPLPGSVGDPQNFTLLVSLGPGVPASEYEVMFFANMGKLMGH